MSNDINIWPGDPVRHGIDNNKRYKAAARGLDGTDVRVYSYFWPGRCSYGFQHWFDREGNDYGQIDLVSPLVIIHAIEELTPEEAEAVDRLFA